MSNSLSLFFSLVLTVSTLTFVNGSEHRFLSKASSNLIEQSRRRSSQVMLNLAKTLSTSIKQSINDQTDVILDLRSNVSTLSLDLENIRDRLEVLEQNTSRVLAVDKSEMDGLVNRVLQLEDQRILDEAIWFFNTMVCNASIELLRQDVALFTGKEPSDLSRKPSAQSMVQEANELFEESLQKMKDVSQKVDEINVKVLKVEKELRSFQNYIKNDTDDIKINLEILNTNKQIDQDSSSNNSIGSYPLEEEIKEVSETQDFDWDFSELDNLIRERQKETNLSKLVTTHKPSTTTTTPSTTLMSSSSSKLSRDFAQMDEFENRQKALEERMNALENLVFSEIFKDGSEGVESSNPPSANVFSAQPARQDPQDIRSFQERTSHQGTFSRHLSDIKATSWGDRGSRIGGAASVAPTPLIGRREFEAFRRWAYSLAEKVRQLEQRILKYEKKGRN